MFTILILGAVFVAQGNGQSGLRQPLSLPGQFGGFSSSQLPIGAQSPSFFPLQFPQQVNQQTGGGGGGGGDNMPHTYPDGTTGGDYHAKMAEKGQTQPGVHTYPDGTMGHDYPEHKAQLQQQQQQQQQQFGVKGTQPGGHTYPDGTTGHNYPEHKAQQQQQLLLQQQQQQPQFGVKVTPSGGHTYPDGTTGHNYPEHKAQQQKQLQLQQQLQQQQFGVKVTPSGGHTYPDGTTGHDYPTHKAQQQQQAGLLPQGGFQQGGLPQGGFQQGVFQPSNFQQTGFLPGGFPQSSFQQPGHTYKPGEGGNYPTVKAAQQGGHAYQPSQDGDYPTVKAQQQGGFPQTTGHAYQPGEDGDYPTVKAQQQGGFKGGQFFPGQGGGGQQSPQFLVGSSQGFSPQQFVPQTSKQQFVIPTGNAQVFPPSSATAPLFSPTRAATDSNSLPFQDSEPRIAVQRAPTSFQGGPGSRNSYDAFGLGAQQGGQNFFPSSRQTARLGQCFKYEDLSAGYKLSDVINEYPIDAIMSELRSRPYMAPMVGYENIPKQKTSSVFSSFGSPISGSLDFGFDEEKSSFGKLSNTKFFPPAFDENKLSSAMKPLDKVCPSQPFTLRTFHYEGNRCHVVNPDYQTITYTKCLRRECNLCGVGQGVNACVERYNWVSVVVYCPHWARNERVQTLRLYLPQGCTCNRYEC